MNIRKWLLRWQTLVFLLPLLVVFSVSGWVVLGALEARLSTDAINWLIELPILSAHAVAVTGLAYLAWRHWRMHLDAAQKVEYWARLMAGERGPLMVYCVNAGVYLCLFFGLLWLFSP